MAADLLIVLLRQSQGGSTSGYGPLAILPVVWVALTLGRRSVVAIAASTTLLFALPILLIGAPSYPSSGWRGVVLWTVSALVVGGYRQPHRRLPAARSGSAPTRAPSS